MLRKILESALGQLTNAQFAEVMDLTTSDIKVNRFSYAKRTSLNQVVEIAVRCFIAAGRGKVA